MRIPRIYTPQVLNLGACIDLEPQASIHLSKVLRFSEGDAVIVFNGQGGQFQSNIVSISKKHVALELVEFQDISLESPLACHIAVCLSKGDKVDWIVQKATELGVLSITPMLSERCDIKLNAERFAKKQKQWQAIAVSACEQSGRNTVPEVKALTKLIDWFEVDATKIICEPQADEKFSEFAGAQHQPLHFAFGPEGGFSEQELKQAEVKGATLLRFGPRVLRAETAPIAVLSAAQVLWGDC